MKPRFVDSLYVVRIREARGCFGRTRWRLESQLRYDSIVYGKTIAVPAGYETDFASVPRLPLSYAIAGDTAHTAAVVHDYLYSTPGVAVTRRIADAVFREAMMSSGVPRWRAWIMWIAVRLFGWLAFKCRVSDIENV